MISKRLLSTPVIMAGLAIVLPALAQTTGLDNPLGTVVDPRVVIGNVIRAMLGIVGSLALAVFIFGGFNWVIAAGNEEKIKKGKSMITWATFGLVIIFASYALVTFVIDAVTGGTGNSGTSTIGETPMVGETEQ